MESKEARFRRIAAKRTNEVIEKIRILGNCSNKSSYKYTPQEINKIFLAIEVALKQNKSKFTFREKSKFNL